jgi:hypothetical protein
MNRTSRQNDGALQVHDSRVGQPGGVPAVAGIPEHLGYPDGIDPQAGLGMGLEDL